MQAGRCIQEQREDGEKKKYVKTEKEELVRLVIQKQGTPLWHFLFGKTMCTYVGMGLPQISNWREAEPDNGKDL